MNILLDKLILILAIIFIAGCSTSFEVGDSLYREGQYSEAVDSLRKFVNANPNDAVGHYTLADSLYLKYSTDYKNNNANTNDLNLSSMHFAKAIELDPNYAEAYCQRGVTRLVLGDVAGSKQDYENAIRIKPNLDRVYFNRGYWYEQQGRLQEAILDYEKYVFISKNNKWRDDALRRIEALKLKLQLQGK